MRLLSVVIPSYNTELYLARCLDSLLYHQDILELLDIIIVNDGSTDYTLEIAKGYQEKYPNTITVIDKPNGGHGSTINAGMKITKGKYFKVLDSDDWVNIFDFKKFVQQLKNLNDDILITNYQQDRLYDSSVVEFNFYSGNDKSQDISDLVQYIDQDDFFFMFSMHSMTIKTASLKKVWNDGLLEKTFYVDQQYVAKALNCAKTFRTLNYDIYRYFIGRPEQSVNWSSFFKHRQDHGRVLRWLLELMKEGYISKHDFLAAALHRQIKAMITTHYELYYTAIDASSAEIAEIFEFDTFLTNNFPQLHTEIPAARNIRRRLSPLRRTVKRNLLKSRSTV